MNRRHEQKQRPLSVKRILSFFKSKIFFVGIMMLAQLIVLAVLTMLLSYQFYWFYYIIPLNSGNAFRKFSAFPPYCKNRPFRLKFILQFIPCKKANL